MHRRDRRSFGAFVHDFSANFGRSTLPMPARLLVTARNLARRAILRQGCCDHHGEPGC